MVILYTLKSAFIIPKGNTSGIILAPFTGTNLRNFANYFIEIDHKSNIISIL